MICSNYQLLKRLGARDMTIFVFSILKLEKLILFDLLKARDHYNQNQREISCKMRVLRPSETVWGSSYDLFCVFNAYLCGPSLAFLAGEFFFTIFHVHPCGPSQACLAGAKFLKIFNVYLRDSVLAGLAGAKLLKILLFASATPP